MRADKIKAKGKSFRGILAGYPGAGKTGALASLLNAGYKVRMIDYEGNYDPLLEYVDPRAMVNLDIVTLQDKISTDGDKIQPQGIPTAFNRTLELLKEWKYTDEDGEAVNLGKSADWGPDTVVVIDSMTGLGEAALRLSMKMNNKTPSNLTPGVYQDAVTRAMWTLDVLKRDDRNYHLIVLAHLFLYGPQDVITMDDAKSDNKPVRDAKLEAIELDLVPTKLLPKGVTKNNSNDIAGKLPTLLLVERAKLVGKDTRIIRTVSDLPVDVKLPLRGAKPYYPVDTGMAEIFKAMGHKAPGFE